eukprot:gene9636-3061_t
MTDDHTHVVSFSDGARQQFKARKFAVVLARLCREHGIKSWIHTFFESYHGKSLCDVVGGMVKDRAQTEVLSMNDSERGTLSASKIVSLTQKFFKARKPTDILKRVTTSLCPRPEGAELEDLENHTALKNIATCNGILESYRWELGTDVGDGHEVRMLDCNDKEIARYNVDLLDEYISDEDEDEEDEEDEEGEEGEVEEAGEGSQVSEDSSDDDDTMKSTNEKQQANRLARQEVANRTCPICGKCVKGALWVHYDTMHRENGIAKGRICEHCTYKCTHETQVKKGKKVVTE